MSQSSASLINYQIGADSFMSVQSALATIQGKNRIINGAMLFQQRAAVSVTGAAVYGAVDRYCSGINGAGGAMTLEAGSLVYNGVTYSTARMVVTSPATNLSASLNWTGLMQRIEGFQCYDLVGQPVALQFVMQSTLAGASYNVSLQDSAGLYSWCESFTLPANTPTLVQFSIPPLPAAMTVARNNATGLVLRIGQCNNANLTTNNLGVWQAGNFQGTGSGSGWCTQNGATLDVTLLQLEKGLVCTPFEWEDVSHTVTRCLRYYVGSVTMTGSLFNVQNAGITGYLPVTMRAAPSLSGATNLNIIGVGTPPSPGLVSAQSTPLTAYQQIDWTPGSGALGMTLSGICSANAEL
jgi:hypothetical protein